MAEETRLTEGGSGIAQEKQAEAAPRRVARASVKALRAEVESLKQQLAECNDRFLRKAAELDNYKKRVQRELAEVVVNANAELVRALLPILDDLERAVQQEPAAASFEQFREGVRLIWGKMLRVLEERGLVAIQALGQPFDPERHEALMQTESEGAPANTVVVEHQRGYEFQGRILRPAKVVVSK
ncbi:MAG: nucleotide exchange factor GrpE [candidate division KSB1 bacterium]|nr:nucleotide exchange factor GrpE [candidate division KSB1 bacterium]MDZ7337556.1 nucleotide exchange factor GrpE [candidate division KSB1 bacterium]MDZ7378875.1 nucleotide exchange factor GrpE [candidate division KSB1 bacterium]MDZ7385221.1 nucleotide exchange factor GrpE [candidate division KSB1 bacterium]MDZ7392333.1 nucleotide exchange factor GrpE [candidate division KSB1 bacterium]